MPSTVLHLNTEASWRGGEAQTLHLAAGLLRRGWPGVVAAVPDSPLARRAAALGIPVEPLRPRGEWDLAAAARLAGLIGRHQVGILHYHTAHAVAIGSLASLRAGRRPAFAARRVSFPLRHRVLARWKYTWRVDRVIAVSEAIRRGLIGQGIPADRVVTVHSGIEPGRFREGDRARFRSTLPGPAASWPRDALLIGTVGHLAAHKGIDQFLRACALVRGDLPGVRFVVVGRGEQEASLRAEAERLGLGDRVTFAGFRDDMPDVFAGLDVFVLASRSGEGSPAVLKEAMAAGTPIAATALDGVEEIIEDARHALLTTPGDDRALAGAITRLARDRDLRVRLAAAARRRVEDFTVDRMVEATIQVYGSLRQGER
jgi:glycosyltransferase involved in cell wall biosynthesis